MSNRPASPKVPAAHRAGRPLAARRRSAGAPAAVRRGTRTPGGSPAPASPRSPRSRHADGRAAELAAALWLEAQGFRIVERNLANRAGEIDLVAWEGAVLCFVEIKARTRGRFGGPLAAVGRAKQRRLSRAAVLHTARAALSGVALRFDVLGLERPSPDSQSWEFTLIRDAFSFSP